MRPLAPPLFITRTPPTLRTHHHRAITDRTPPPHLPYHTTQEEDRNNMKREDPIQTRGITTYTTPRHSTRATEQTTRGTPIPNEGAPTHRREGHHHSSRPSITMPPHLVRPPHHPQWPPPPPLRGGSRCRIPHHTKERREILSIHTA